MLKNSFSQSKARPVAAVKVSTRAGQPPPNRAGLSVSPGQLARWALVLVVVVQLLGLPILTGNSTSSFGSAGVALAATGDVTKEGCDTATDPTNCQLTRPGQKVNWVVGYNNSSGQTQPQVQLTDQIRDGQQFVVGSLKVPPGWQGAFSNDAGASFGYAPVANAQGTDPAVNFLRFSGTQVPSPATGVVGQIGSLAVAASVIPGGGDGWRPIYVANTNKFYVINHHTKVTISCFDPTTTAVCTGYPKSLPTHPSTGNAQFTSNQIREYVDPQGHIFYVVGTTFVNPQTNVAVIQQWLNCFDTATDAACGTTLMATLGNGDSAQAPSGLVKVGNTIYTFLPTGVIMACPWPAASPCAPVAANIGNPDNQIPNLVGVAVQGSRIWYTSPKKNVNSNPFHNTFLGCFDTATQALCAGWTPQLANLGNNNSGYDDFGFPFIFKDKAGQDFAICSLASISSLACYSLTNFTAVAGPPNFLAGIPTTGTSNLPTSFAQGLNLGNRLYLPGSGGPIDGSGTALSRDYCYDFTTQQPCWNPGYKQWAFNPAGYEFISVGKCLYGFGDSGVLYSVDPISGASPCIAEQSVDLTADPSQYYCDGKDLVAAHGVAWDKVKLNSAIPGGMTSLTATVWDATSNQVLINAGSMLPSGQLALSSINFSQHPKLKVTLQGQGQWAANLEAGLYWSGDKVQMCYQTLVPQNYTPHLVTDTVTLTGDPPVTKTLSIPGLAIVKQVDKTVASPGDILTYSVVVTNQGGIGATLSGIAVADPVAVSGATLVTGSITLNPSAAGTAGTSLPNLATLNLTGGASATITFQLQLPSTGLAQGQIVTNTATATPPVSSGLPPITATATTIIQYPDLSQSTKDVSGAGGSAASGYTTTPGGVLTYTVKVNNTGPVVAKGVTATDTLDPSLAVPPTNISSGGVYDANTRTITWGGLDVPAATQGSSPTTPGEVDLTYQVTVLTTAASGTVIHNTATITPPTGGSCGNQPTCTPTAPPVVVQTPDLSQSTKDVSGQSGPGLNANPGDKVTYTVNVTNTGPVAAPNTVVTDTISTYLEDPTNISNGGTYDGATRTITWSGLTIPAATISGTTTTAGQLALTYQTVVKSGLAGGTIIPNTAHVVPPTGFGPPADPKAPDLTVNGPNLSLSNKQVTGQSGPDNTVKIGDNLTYTINVVNAGLAAATGVSVTDVVNANLADPTNITSGGVYDSATRTITWSNLTIPAATSAGNGQVILSFETKVKLASSQGAVVTNTATVWPPKECPPAQAQACTQNPKAPDLTVTKPDLSTSTKTVSGQSGPGSSGVKVGDTVTYTIVVNNTGQREATSVPVSDTLTSPYFGLPPTNISDGGQYDSAIKTVSWTVPQVAAGASKALTFQVTIVEPTTGAGGTSGVVTNTGHVGDPPECVKCGADPKAPDLTFGTPNLATSAKGVTTASTNQAVVYNANSTGSGSTTASIAVQPGEIYTYTIAIKNSGPVAASGVRASDTLDPNLLLVDTTLPNGGSYDTASRTLSWSNLTIPAASGGSGGAASVPGELDLAFRVKVLSTTPSGTTINNTGVIVPPPGSGGDGCPVATAATTASGSSNVCQVVAPPVGVNNPTVQIKKTVRSVLSSQAGGSGPATDGKIHLGDTVEYTVRMTNPGPQKLTGVVFTDGFDYLTNGRTNMQGVTYVGNSVKASLDPAPADATTSGQPTVTGQPLDGQAKGNLVVSVSALEVNQTLVIVFRAKVSANAGDIQNNMIENQAFATSDQTTITGSDGIKNPRHLLSDDPTTPAFPDPTDVLLTPLAAPTPTPTPPPLPAQTGENGVNVGEAGQPWYSNWLALLALGVGAVGTLGTLGAGGVLWWQRRSRRW